MEMNCYLPEEIKKPYIKKSLWKAAEMAAKIGATLDIKGQNKMRDLISTILGPINHLDTIGQDIVTKHEIK